jgi:enterochelin esterase-like enzyme
MGTNRIIGVKRMERKCLLFPIALMVFLSGCRSTPSTSDKPNAAAADTPAASSLKVVTFKSQALDKEMKLSVYLPKGYTTTKKYPALYMLHAFAGNESNWMPNLALNEKADQLIDQGKIKPIIIISPQFDNSYGLIQQKKRKC